MHTFLALVLLALAYALARPSAPAEKRMMLSEIPPHEFYEKYLVRRALIPNYYLDDLPRYEPHLNEDLLDKEIDMINRMNMRERLPMIHPAAFPYWIQGYPQIPLLEPVVPDLQPINLHPMNLQPMNMEPMDYHPMNLHPMGAMYESHEVATHDVQTNMVKKDKTEKEIKTTSNTPVNIASEKKKTKITKEEKNKHKFALTPFEAGYYDHKDKVHGTVEYIEKPKSAIGPMAAAQILEPLSPRQTRQNPNLSKTKTLVAENLERLRIGLANKELRIPVSLVPLNLRWLKKYEPHDHESPQDKSVGTDKPPHFHVLETPTADPAESLFGVALLAAVGASLAMALIAFGIGWYTLSKKAKAAADVDYPAYGVTGPTIDATGDRKLAHSAHMYHYQHQKQQIIAMERSGMDQRNGSVSDPESEEENEEGDYTVYECPGFATTGDMEVKNPLFQDETTPATPGKAEKPQKE
ncbi:uncharacterized protein LOC121739422 [Aricia agestis]|uniref:uncharacterized protein LOC121739422 n=1 Tax=Aricia agestis TaxID=91739 RepID=UPI001C202047|nr:uncharacterized protein LOC121739422 [Aricia agestis]